MGSVRSVVIDDLYIGGSGVRPNEADAVLVVDPDTVLTEAITLQRLQTIPRWDPQIDERFCRVERLQLALRDTPDRRNAGATGRLRVGTVEHVFRAGIPERAYHLSTIA